MWYRFMLAVLVSQSSQLLLLLVYLFICTYTHTNILKHDIVLQVN